MKRCVVTGASGLLGSNLVPFLARDWQVHAISRFRPPAPMDPNIVWHPLDLSQEIDWSTLPPDADAVIYLAQSEHFREFPERALEIFEVNTASALRFLDYARRIGARTVIYASSGGVYGSGAVGVSEEAPIPARGDLGFYLSTKLCSEIAAQNYTRHFDMVILRYFFVYGAAQRPHMLIPRLISRIRQGQSIQLQGKNGIQLNPIHVSDAAAATAHALTVRGSHTINVGGPDVLSMRDIGVEIGRQVGHDPFFDVDLNASPSHLTGDISKMKEMLVPPQIPFREGLAMVLKGQR